MRTYNDSNKHASNQSSGRYTGNGFIPSKQAHKSQGGCLSSLLVIIIPVMGIVAYIVSMVVLS